MVTKISRRHHYIPKMLLRNFCDQGRLWVGDRAQQRVFQCAPGKVFLQRDLNARYLLDQVSKDLENSDWPGDVPMSDEYEQTLARIDSNAAPVIQRIIAQARIQQPPNLSVRQSDSWKRFMFAMAARTPESQERVLSGKDRDVFYEAAKFQADIDNYDLPDKEALYKEARILKFKEFIETNTYAKFAAGIHPRAQELADEFCDVAGLFAAIICIPRRSFVIGSHGIAIVESAGNRRRVKESWLPIAHDVAVLATASPENVSLLELDRDRDPLIKRINRASAAQSRFIAGRSEALIRSLMKG